MNFTFAEQQQVASDALSQLLSRFRELPVLDAESYIDGAALDAELVASGFHDIAAAEELGGVSAVDLIIQVARIGPVAEVAASTLVRPLLCPDAPRPLALVRGARAIRFGLQAKTALIDGDGEVLRLDIAESDFEPLETLFAYPLARLSDKARSRATPVDIPNAPALLHRSWRIGLAAEIVGAMEASLALTVDYVSQRQQFGQPIGSFQALQHRLAEAAVAVESARWLVFKAADSNDPADALLAAGYAQDAARRVTYDFHQFHGAMGLTLEHSLHLWTYRLRVLMGELDGAGAHFDAAAQAVWGAPAPAKA